LKEDNPDYYNNYIKKHRVIPLPRGVPETNTENKPKFGIDV